MRNPENMQANIEQTRRAQVLASALAAIRQNGEAFGLSRVEIETALKARQEELEGQWREEDTPKLLPAGNCYAADGHESTMDAVNESNRITLANLQRRYRGRLNNPNAILDEIYAYAQNPKKHAESLELQNLKRRNGYNATTAARAIAHYRLFGLDNPIVNELCAFWRAARDAAITESTVENRTAAFMIALENAVRGKNRTTGVRDRDDLQADNSICPTGAGNLLYISMTSINNGYNAVHPDDVYAPVLTGPVNTDIAEYVRAAFKKVYALRSSVDKKILKEQSDCDDESKLTTAQLSCWTRFRDEVIKTAYDTILQACGTPDAANQRRIRKQCEEDCVQLREYGEYDVPEEKEVKEASEVRVHVNANTPVEQQLYDYIFTQAQTLLATIPLGNNRADNITDKLLELNVDILAVQLMDSSANDVVIAFFNSIGEMVASNAELGRIEAARLQEAEQRNVAMQQQRRQEQEARDSAYALQIQNQIEQELAAEDEARIAAERIEAEHVEAARQADIQRRKDEAEQLRQREEEAERVEIALQIEQHRQRDEKEEAERLRLEVERIEAACLEAAERRAEEQRLKDEAEEAARRALVVQPYQTEIERLQQRNAALELEFVRLHRLQEQEVPVVERKEQAEQAQIAQVQPQVVLPPVAPVILGRDGRRPPPPPPVRREPQVAANEAAILSKVEKR